MKRSIFYRSPRMYKLMLWAVHGKHLKERYGVIAEELGDAKSVLEPLCSPALLPKHLRPEVKYSGFDLNEKFVDYARSKGHPVLEGDALDQDSYREAADGVALIDALHHIQPYEDQQRVVELAAGSALKRLVVCDPFADRYLDMVDKFPFLRKPAEWIFNWIETDGPNQSRYDSMIRREVLEERMSNGFEVLSGVKHEIKQVGPEDLVATYYFE
jgi:hypothetical protein